MQKPKNVSSPTACTRPPALSDDELLAVLDGDSPAEVQSHLEQCRFCSARLEEMRQIEEGLLMELYRSNCPSAAKLADYAMELLSSSEQMKLDEHLQTCLRCQQEVAALRTIFDFSGKPSAAEAAVEPLWQQVKGFVRALGEGLVRVLQPQTNQPTIQLKGSDKPFVLSYGNEAVTVLLALEKVASGLKINGNIIDLDDQEQWQDSQVELVSKDAQYYLALADEDEMFTFEDIPPGQFKLNVYLANGHILRIEDLNLTV